MDALENRMASSMQTLEDRNAALIAAEVGNLQSEMQAGFAP
jgi:hypothetical protein